MGDAPATVSATVSTTSTPQYTSPVSTSTSTFVQPIPSPTPSQATSASPSSQFQRLAASTSEGHSISSNESNPSNASNPPSPTSSQTQSAGNYTPVPKRLGFILGMAVGFSVFGIFLFAGIWYKCRKMRHGQSSMLSDREHAGFTPPSHLLEAEGMSDRERLRSSATHTMRSNGIEIPENELRNLLFYKTDGTTAEVEAKLDSGTEFNLMRLIFFAQLGLIMTETPGERLTVGNGQELVVLGHSEIKFRSARYWWKRYTMTFFIVEQSLPLPVILGNRFMGFSGIFLVDRVLLTILPNHKRAGGEESEEAAKRREEEAEAEAAAQEENKDSGESRRDDSNADSSSSSGTGSASTEQAG